MSSNGNTALHTPAMAAAPGMPQTTLVASSWAITVPPASATAPAPASPSLPMPGPGHYRFTDFVRAGLPLIVLMWLVFTLFAPWYYGI